MDVTARFAGADRLVRPGRGDPAADLDHPRPGGADRRPAADAADRPAAQAAGPARLAPAPPDGPAVQHRHRHRRRPAGAARHRRRAGLPRPLPPRVADHPPGRASRSPGCSRSWTRSRCSCPGSSWCSWSGSGRGTPSQGTITRRRAGRVLRLLGVPDDPAADRDRVRQQADPGPGRGPPGLPRAARSSPTSSTRPSPPSRRRRAPTWSTCAPGCGCAPGCSPPWSATSPRRRRTSRTGSACTRRPSRARSTTTSGSAAYRSPRCAARTCAAGSSSPTPARRCSPAGSATGWT